MKSTQKLNSSGSVLIIFVLLLLAVALGVIGTLFYFHLKTPSQPQTLVQTPIISPTPIASFQPISSSGKSYPIIKTYRQPANPATLELYQLTQPIGIIGTPIKLGVYGGGSLGQGENNPLVSPDLGKIAYFGQDGLHITTGDGKQNQLISDQIKDGYFTGWSHDSKKLLVYGQPVLKSPFPSSYDGYGVGSDPDHPLDYEGYASSFYLVDTEKGTIFGLSNLADVRGWIDNDHLLITKPDSKTENFTTYSVKADGYKADIPNLDSYFGFQESFSQDGKKWAITLANTGDNSSNSSFSRIVLADFPKIEGNLIDSGTWAEVQQPVISPDGTKVAYVKNSQTAFWQNGQTKTLVSNSTNSRPIIWADETHFIYNVWANSTSNASIYLYETESGKTQTLYQAPPDKSP
jgi:hypothetical protein